MVKPVDEEKISLQLHCFERKTEKIQKWVKERKKREKLCRLAAQELKMRRKKWEGERSRKHCSEQRKRKTVLLQFGEILTCLCRALHPCTGCRNTLVHQKRLRWLWSTLEERRPAGVESVEAEENQKKCWSGRESDKIWNSPPTNGAFNASRLRLWGWSGLGKFE